MLCSGYSAHSRWMQAGCMLEPAGFPVTSKSHTEIVKSFFFWFFSVMGLADSSSFRRLSGPNQESFYRNMLSSSIPFINQIKPKALSVKKRLLFILLVQVLNTPQIISTMQPLGLVAHQVPKAVSGVWSTSPMPEQNQFSL